MPRFFLPPDQFPDNADHAIVDIDGENARHISLSLRMKVADRLTLCDGAGREFDAEIIAMTAQTVSVRIETVRSSLNESPVRITLYQGIAKGDKMDSIIQKAVELGMSEIVPVECQRSVAKIGSDSVEKKVKRWQKIADAAAGQSGRGLLPKVHPPMKFANAVERAASDECALLCYEGEGTQPLSLCLPPEAPATLSFFIGPEGGFEYTEVELAGRFGLVSVGLGRRILRTETASSFVLSALCLTYEMPNLLKK